MSTHKEKKPNERQYSSIVTDGADRAPSRAMLRAVGFKDDDFKKSQIGIVSTWSMVTPCNMHIDKLAQKAAQGTDGPAAKRLFLARLLCPTEFQWEAKE